jgi:hypothetical protein
MKIRSGFVSNSSSTSYVIVVPEDFDVDSLVYSHLDELKEMYRQSHRKEFPPYKAGQPKPKVFIPFDYIDKFIQKFKKHLKAGGIHYEEGWELYYAVAKMMKEYVVSDIETGPDAGIIEFMSEKKLKEKLAKIKNDKMPDDEKEKLKKRIQADREVWEKELEEKDKRKALLKDKMKGVDPYGEEEWGDID